MNSQIAIASFWYPFNFQDKYLFRSNALFIERWTAILLRYKKKRENRTMKMQASITVALIVFMSTMHFGVDAWGGLFNRFSPEMLSNLGYGGHGGYLSRSRLLQVCRSSNYFHFLVYVFSFIIKIHWSYLNLDTN